jgi:Conjugative relaxosome accessory transposon protein
MRKSILRGLLCLALSFNIALLPTLAQADVAEAFKSLLSDGANVAVSSPGQFSSQARNSFVAGGLDVRFPNRAAPQILSITPFRIQAGCGGVSLFFGGFSFISGQEIVALIKAVAQNAIGLAVELVMTTLCGPCASVMQIMRQLALAAANKALDSCQIAKALMNSASSSMGVNAGAAETSQDTCTNLGAMWGNLTDQSAAQNGASNLCNDMKSAIGNGTQWVSKALTAAGIDPKSPLGQKELCSKQLTCNTMWTLLNQTDLYDNSNVDNIRDKLLIMNITGTTIKTAGNALGAPASPTGNSATAAAGGGWLAAGPSLTGSTSSTTPGASGTPGVDTAATAGPNTFAPTLGNLSKTDANNMKNVFKLLECGVPGSPNIKITDPRAQDLVNAECSDAANSDGSTASLAQIQVWDCADSTATSFSFGDSGYQACTTLFPVPLGNTALATNEGYLYYVANLLFAGVAAVQNNTPLDPNLIALIQEVPVPIYQAINVSAVYPDAGYQLISSMSVEVAQMLIYEHIRDLVQVAGRFKGDLAISSADFDRVLEFFGQMNADTQANDLKVASQITRQQVMMGQIRSVNLAIQNEVMTPELLGAHRYGTALNQQLNK